MATGMTTQLKDMARSAPGAARGARPLATWREDLTGDGDRHLADHGAVLRRAQPQQQDRPGVVLLARPHRALHGHVGVRRLPRPDRCAKYQARAGARPLRGIVDLKAIPVGYGVAFIGLCILGVAGPWDLIWHSVYGFEVNVEAIVSPPHLLLFFGGLLVSSTGIRSMWAKRDLAPDFRALPARVHLGDRCSPRCWASSRCTRRHG